MAQEMPIDGRTDTHEYIECV